MKTTDLGNAWAKMKHENGEYADYIPPDYSLNDFEALIKGAYTGSKKEKAVILRAIEDYKTMADRM